MTSINRIKYIVRILVGTLLGLYIGLLVLLNIPFVQEKLGAFVSNELKHLLKTEVSVGHVDLGFLNRIIVEDVLLKDHKNEDMLKVKRLSAKFELLPLLKKQLRINTIQLFGFHIHLNKETPESVPNYQFVLDALASKDTTKTDTHLDLRINSVIVRRGNITYDVHSIPPTPGKFNASHVNIDNFALTLSLKALRKDTLNATLRRISFKEESGFELKKLSLKAIANNQQLNISNFKLELPNSILSVPLVKVQYDSLPSLSQLSPDMKYEGEVEGNLLPTDFSTILPVLSALDQPVEVSIGFEGNGKQVDIPLLAIKDHKFLNLEGKAKIDGNGEQTYYNGKISKLNVNKEGIAYLMNGLTGKVPSILQNLQFIDFVGNVYGHPEHLTSDGILKTGAGTLQADVTMNMDNNDKRSYSGTLVSPNLDLGILTGNSQKFGIADFNIALNGFNYRDRYPESTIK